MTRLLAWELLREPEGTPTRRVGAAARERGLDPRDRALLRRIVGTEVRRRGTLRALVARFGRGRPSPDLAAFLRIGLVQLFFLDQVPDHAAVSETVRAAADALGLSKARYVNAVLRAAIEARRPGHCGDARRDLVGRDLHLSLPVFADPAQHPFLWAEDALSMPAPLVKRWAKRYGRERALELARSALEEPPLSLRACAGDGAALASELRSSGLACSPGLHPAIVLVPAAQTERALASEAFRAGRASVQGETALRAAELCAAQAGERWLDLCAAPGGKTAVLAARGAQVVACDRDAERVERVARTLERLGLGERAVLCVAGEGACAEEARFDGLLVDVPCSNTGVLAQRPEARWRFGPRSQRELALVQEELLARGARALRPGGRLVLSTCSIEPDENQRRVRAFLEAHPGWTLEAELEALPAPLEARGPVDGGYAALLQRPQQG